MEKQVADHLRGHQRLPRRVPGRRQPAATKRSSYTFLDTRHPEILKADRGEEGHQGRAHGQAQGRARGVRRACSRSEPAEKAQPSHARPRRHPPAHPQSVKNTQQITKAMKMVSAAKLRRAQDAMFAARPYARKMMEVLSSMAARARAEAHPLLEQRGGRAHPARARDRRQGAVRRLQRQHHPHRRALPRRTSGRSASSWSWSGARAATSSGAASTACARSRSASSRPCATTTAQKIAHGSSGLHASARWTRSTSSTTSSRA